jgi:hypothetical protein
MNYSFSKNKSLAFFRRIQRGVAKCTALVLALMLVFNTAFFVSPPQAYAATSPSLGQADSFAVLAGTAITNVPTSVITGDVGLSPAAGTNITGLTSAEVSGTIYAVDATGPDGSDGNNPTLVNQAKADLVTAYDQLALGENADAECDAGFTFGSGNVDLSGESLAPGVYCADTFTLTGTLTLTGSGVWVFRSAATLTTSGTANVVGGDACDVWWQVPSSATLGTDTSLIGNILALTSITLETDAELEGRALARNGAVTLDSNTVNQSCTEPATVESDSSTTTSSTTSSTTGSSSSSSGGPDPCPPLPAYAEPLIIDSRRVDEDSIFISWGPYSGTDEFIVQYGFEDGVWLYSTDVTGFSTTINDLPPNMPIWVRVAARNNCAVGSYGASRFVGGPMLPSAGTAPQRNTNWLYLPLSIIAGSLLLLKLKQI